MVTWVTVVGALLGAALGYLGAWLSPRWTEQKQRKSWEFAAAAAVSGLIGFLLAHRLGMTNLFWHYLIFSGVLVTASLVDLHDHIIPNDTVIFGLIAGLILQTLSPVGSWMQHLYGAAFGFGLLLLLAVIYKGGMGLGDVKLAAVIGWFLQWPHIGLGLMLAFLGGGLISLILLVTKRIGRKDHLPFGPFLAAGAIATAIWGPQILDWYLGR